MVVNTWMGGRDVQLPIDALPEPTPNCCKEKFYMHEKKKKTKRKRRNSDKFKHGNKLSMLLDQSKCFTIQQIKIYVHFHKARWYMYMYTRTSTFNFWRPILLPYKRPTSNSTSSGRTRQDMLFNSLFNFICLYGWAKT